MSDVLGAVSKAGEAAAACIAESNAREEAEAASQAQVTAASAEAATRWAADEQLRVVALGAMAKAKASVSPQRELTSRILERMERIASLSLGEAARCEDSDSTSESDVDVDTRDMSIEDADAHRWTRRMMRSDSHVLL